MEKFLRELGSVYWWVSVVIVGLIINIISGFGFKYFDAILVKFFSQRRGRREAKELQHKEKIEELKGNDFEKVIQSNYVLFLRINAIIYLLLGVIYTLFVIFLYTSKYSEKMTKPTLKLLQLPIFLIIIFTLLGALHNIRESIKENKILWKARHE